MGWKRFFKAAIYSRGVERFVRHILQLVDFYRSNIAESSIRRHFKIGIIQIELAIQRFRRFSFQINFSSTKYCEILYASQTVFESHTKCDFIVMRQFDVSRILNEIFGRFLFRSVLFFSGNCKWVWYYCFLVWLYVFWEDRGQYRTIYMLSPCTLCPVVDVYGVKTSGYTDPPLRKEQKSDISKKTLNFCCLSFVFAKIYNLGFNFY